MTGCCFSVLTSENQTKNVDHVYGYTAGSTVQPGFFLEKCSFGGQIAFVG